MIPQKQTAVIRAADFSKKLLGPDGTPRVANEGFDFSEEMLIGEKYG
jgi:hypothetical protein